MFDEWKSLASFSLCDCSLWFVTLARSSQRIHGVSPTLWFRNILQNHPTINEKKKKKRKKKLKKHKIARCKIQNERIKVTKYTEYTLQCMIQKWQRRATSANGWRTQRRNLLVWTSLKKRNCLVTVKSSKPREREKTRRKYEGNHLLSRKIVLWYNFCSSLRRISRQE